MTTPKFNLGDKVILKGTNLHTFITTISTKPGNPCEFGIKGCYLTYEESELELVEEPKLFPDYRDCPQEEPKVQKKEWPCWEITFSNILNNWTMNYEGKGYSVEYHWKLCPVCGASRPREKTSLEDVIGKFISPYRSDISGGHIAQAVREHIRGKEREVVSILLNQHLIETPTGHTFAEEVARLIIEAVGK